MCYAVIYKVSPCECRFLTLVEPCARGRDLLSCPLFAAHDPARRAATTAVCARLPPFEEQAAPSPWCPHCHLRGEYDVRVVRRVEKESRGWRVGMGPGAKGFNCGCVVM